MKLLIAVFLSLGSTQFAFADTGVIFSKDGSKATILMLAGTTNPDAVGLNDVMNVPIEDNNGKDLKRISFVQDDGNKGFEAFCAFSKLVPSTGSCSIVFFQEGYVLMDSYSESITYVLIDEEASRLSSFFVLPNESGEVFRSINGRLVIYATIENGSALEFQITYNQ